jgi:hypothetical protein
LKFFARAFFFFFFFFFSIFYYVVNRLSAANLSLRRLPPCRCGCAGIC